MLKPGQALVKSLEQVCVVVRDLDQTVRDYVERAGIGPWAIYNYAPPDLHNMRIRGKPASYSMCLALAWTEGIMWEVIQPVEGPSIYREFLDTHGEGVQHVMVHHTRENLREALAEFERRGCATLMEGSYKGTDFAYLDTAGPLKTVIELVQRPNYPGYRRPAPERWYPSAPDAPFAGGPWVTDATAPAR